MKKHDFWGIKLDENKALNHEIVKILMNLSRKNAKLAPQYKEGCKPEHFIVEQGGTANKKFGRLSSDFVKMLRARDLVAPLKDAFVLSEPGRAWLKRALAGNDSFREQHQERAFQTAEIDGLRKPALVDQTESPLGWLRSRKDKTGQPLIDKVQFEAGERLRADFFHAAMTPRVTASWDGIPSDQAARRAGPGGATNLREQTVAAQQRVRRALRQLGPDLSGILIDVCRDLKGLKEAETARGWPRRSAKLVLQIALNELARHYGLIRHKTQSAY